MKIRGSITVFISIILSVLIAFSGIVVDLSRFHVGEKHARAAVQLSVQSALTQYFAPLKDNYGLWANGFNEEELEVFITDLIERNLSVENMFIPGIVDLFGFSVDNVSVYPMFNLADEQVLEKEITQYMKYRAPVNTIGLFLEKLKALNMFLAQSGLLNKRMNVEDKLQKVREDQVYLNLLLTEKIPLYTDNEKPFKDIDNNLLSMFLLCSEIENIEKPNESLDAAYLAMPSLIENIEKARNKINEVENQISELEYEIKPLQREYSQVKNRIDSCYDEIEDIQKEISKLEDKISKEEKKDEPSENVIRSYREQIYDLKSSIRELERSISSLNTDLENTGDRMQNIRQKISIKNDEIKSIKASIEREKKELKCHIDTCAEILGKIKQKANKIKETMVEINNTVNRFIRYHEESVKLISAIKNQSEEISLLLEEIDLEIKKQSEKSDNAFLVKIKADMKKLVLTTNAEILNSIKTDLVRNLEWLNEVDTITYFSIEQVNEILSNIQLLIDKTQQIYETLSYIEREVFAPQLERLVNNVNGKINTSASLYIIPSYEIEPAVNQKEKNEFNRWCNKVFKEKNEIEDRDRGYERNLRDNIRKADNKGQKENERSFSGKDGKMSDEELEKLFKSLPSNKNNESDSLLLYRKENAEPEEKYKNSLDSNGDTASKISEVLSGVGEALIKSLYVNEYIIGAFNNSNTDKVPTQRINLYGGPSKTFYEKAEVEYILFGFKKEKTNADLAQMSIFSIRMGLNLLHVYMSTDKTSAAMAAAISISGWTGFGVPIVKNLILFGWAAGESYLDLKDINDGKDVPVYKTKNTWRLSLESIFSGIAGQFLDESSEWLKQTKDEWIDKADDAVHALVRDMVSSAVHEAFLPLEKAITELGSETDTADIIEWEELSMLNEVNNMDELKVWINEICEKQYQAIKYRASDWSKVKVEDYKRKITSKILDFIFESPTYKKLVLQLKESLDSVIDAGVTEISGSLKQIGSKIGDQGMQSQLVGTVVSFDYTDYLRLLLIAVPQKTKLLRAADLIQLNMRETLDNQDFMLSMYNSFIIVEADISMRAMFMPALPNKELGKFKIRWGYGY